MEQFIKSLGKKTELIYSDIYQCLCVKKELDADGAIFMKKLAELNLPNSPKVLEITNEYLLTAYINGLNLDEYIEQHGKCSAQMITNIVHQIAKPLQIMHRQGMIHRDIKPGNIIINDEGIAHLIDFDTSRVTKENQQQDTELLGTRGYASPEHFGFQSTDERSDIYSIGAVMQNCLDPREQSFELTTIYKKAMSLDPGDRYQNLSSLLTAFSHIGLYEEIPSPISLDSIDVPINFVKKSQSTANTLIRGQKEQHVQTEFYSTHNKTNSIDSETSPITFKHFLHSPILIIVAIIFIIFTLFMFAVYVSLLKDSPNFATSLGYLSICFVFAILPSFIFLLGDHLVKVIRRRKNVYIKYLKTSGILCLVGFLCMIIAVVLELALN